MADHPNIEVFKRALNAFAAGDMDALAKEVHPDAVWHMIGHNPLSGTYRGRDATFALFQREFQLAGGTFRPQLQDVLANDEHTVALLHATASREGKELDMDYVIVFQIRDGQITEARVLWSDQKAYDEFWS